MPSTSERVLRIVNDKRTEARDKFLSLDKANGSNPPTGDSRFHRGQFGAYDFIAQTLKHHINDVKIRKAAAHPPDRDETPNPTKALTHAQVVELVEILSHRELLYRWAILENPSLPTDVVRWSTQADTLRWAVEQIEGLVHSGDVK